MRTQTVLAFLLGGVLMLGEVYLEQIFAAFSETKSAPKLPIHNLAGIKHMIARAEAAAAAEADAAEVMFESASLRAMQEIDSAWAYRKRSEAIITQMLERERELAAEEESMKRQREAGLVQDAEWRQARIERAAAARDLATWTLAGLRNHITLIGALGAPPSDP